MEGLLHAASEAKELLVHEVEKLHIHGNKDSSSSSSSSDEEDEAEKFPRIESAVVALNEKLSSSSSSSSSSDDEAAPAENIIIPPGTVLQDPVEDSGLVAVTEAETIAAESYAEESNGVEVEATEKVVIDESESSENDEKVLPIEEEEAETLVAAAADSLETGDLVSKETEDSPPVSTPIVESGSASAVEEHNEIPVSSGSPVLITTVTHQVRSPTSWMSCCGLFDVLRRDR